ncbi:MAG: LrgB family protein [Betaproteobacteria bacterium]|nr:MAG: LrgB family protein [Betaproteobacteria bacterium]
MSAATTTLFGIALTITAYALSRYVGARVRTPFTTPVFFSTALIICCLVCSGFTATDYDSAKQIMTLLLGPATIALAVPLYNNAAALKRDLLPSALGILAGIIATVVCAVVLAQWLGLPDELVRAGSVKSVTVAVAVQMAEVILADPSLIAGFVIASGMFGAMMGPWILSVCRVTDPLARGLAMGTIAHGQGAAQAALEGELQGAVAGVAMGVTAIVSAALVPGLLAVVM